MIAPLWVEATVFRIWTVRAVAVIVPKASITLSLVDRSVFAVVFMTTNVDASMICDWFRSPLVWSVRVPETVAPSTEFTVPTVRAPFDRKLTDPAVTSAAMVATTFAWVRSKPLAPLPPTWTPLGAVMIPAAVWVAPPPANETNPVPPAVTALLRMKVPAVWRLMFAAPGPVVVIALEVKRFPVPLTTEIVPPAAEFATERFMARLLL